MFTEPSDLDFSIIKEYIQTDEIKQTDLFVYPVCLCDNQVDRENDRFTDEALENIKKKAVGVIGLKNHSWEAEHAHSRIYKTEIEEEGSIKSVIGYAYTIKSQKTAHFIEKIKAGILKEVSIGFKATNFSEEKGIRLINGVEDVFEWSFVAVPAQPRAGVIKEYNEEEVLNTMDLNERIKELETTITSKDAKLKALEQNIVEKDAKIQDLEQAIIRTTLNASVKSILSKFNFKSEKAEALAENIVRDELTVNEDGEVEGCEKAEETLKEDYEFLYDKESDKEDGEDGDIESTGNEDTENTVDEPEVKNYAVIADNLVRKSKKIDFTYIPDKK